MYPYPLVETNQYSTQTNDAAFYGHRKMILPNQPQLQMNSVFNPQGFMNAPINNPPVIGTTDELKFRLNWTPQLHQLFVHAVCQLGGAHNAKPKAILNLMQIDGLTLDHIKSHLQKYRLGRPTGRLQRAPKVPRDPKRRTFPARVIGNERSSSFGALEANKGFEALESQRQNNQLHHQVEVGRTFTAQVIDNEISLSCRALEVNKLEALASQRQNNHLDQQMQQALEPQYTEIAVHPQSQAAVYHFHEERPNPPVSISHTAAANNPNSPPSLADLDKLPDATFWLLFANG